MKAFLRLKGLDLEVLKAIGHRLPKLYSVAVKHGLSEDDEVREVLEISDINYLRARYIETGPFRSVSPEYLWGTCSVLHGEIEPLINSAAGVSRVRSIPRVEME